ncbi:MAG: ABC transporter permease [Cycloclasticus sp. symbiont of Poecilosclerida sp. N]|nr:MAG: ABC transporter permease [Cycloclasticus sp. symbiont of Poecilosclerida sp. N]
MPFSLTVFNNLSIITALLYAGSACLVAVNIISNTPIQKQRLFVLLTAFSSVFLHALLVISSYNVNHAIANDFFSMLSMVFLVISLLFIVSASTQAIESLAIIVFPFSSVAVLLNFGNSIATIQTASIEATLQLHIVLSILSYSLLTVAAFQAIFLSIQEKQLHNQKPNQFINCLPPLQLMEHLLFRVVFLGLCVLTLALATGFVFLEDVFAQHIAHKTVLSILAWIVFATLLCGRYFFGWRGQKAVKWTYSGYITLMLAYFGSKFVLQLILN